MIIFLITQYFILNGQPASTLFKLSKVTPDNYTPSVTEKPLYCLIVSFYVLPVLAMPLSLCVLCVDGHVVT